MRAIINSLSLCLCSSMDPDQVKFLRHTNKIGSLLGGRASSSIYAKLTYSHD